MKKLLQILIILSVLLVPLTAFAHTAENPFVTDLTAGGGNIDSAADVGDVLVWNDAANLYVRYVVGDGEWCLTETHLQVTSDLSGIPQNNGNPIPGQFTYESEHECVQEYTYSIPLTWPPGTQLVIAAHGVGQTEGSGGLAGALPLNVYMTTTFPGVGFGAPSYFDVTVGGGTMLDGTYDAYCVDTDRGILREGAATAYSSYDPLPSSVPIEYPGNLDLANWIINQNFVGKASGCDGAYTYGDVQWAMWQLLEDNPHADHVSLGDWSLCRAQEIVNAAYAHGDGFVPGCGQKLGIILDPVEWRQPVIIWIDVPCVEAEEETAWGGDYFGSPTWFPGANWALYFSYSVQ